MKKIISGSIVISIFLCLIFVSALGVNAYTYAYAEDYSEVYLAGVPVGITAFSSNFMVDELLNITTHEGVFSPAMDKGMQKGDIIESVNGNNVSDIGEFNRIIQESESVELKILRGRNVFYKSIVPIFDPSQNMKKIGMTLRNDISGVGTLTFVTRDGRFGALGHEITDEYGHGSIYSDGKIFDCRVTGYNKPRENIPGELRAVIDYSEVLGDFFTNNISGIYGKYSRKSSFPTYKVSDMKDVVPGKAMIISTIDGITPKYYDIEIIKAIPQQSVADKGLVIRVTDKELLSSTGGILQGMSGSPIIQNGKFVGAVTHVFINDATKGYGIYAEWMIDNLKMRS